MSFTPGRMTPEQERIAGVTLAYLHRCTTKGSALFSEMLTAPRVGSVAETSLQDKDLMEPFYLAGAYLHVALDHYLTVQAMFIPGTPPPGAPVPVLRNYSPYTIVRAAFEADAWACWLLDPGLSPAERLARAMTVRALNVREVRRLGLTSKAGKRVDYGARIARVAEVAKRHNLAEKWNTEGDLVWVGAPPPDATKLLIELLPDPGPDTNGEPLGWHTYSLLSARAHGDPWAVIHNAQGAAPIGAHAAFIEVVIDVVELMRLLSISLRLHSEAMCRAAILNGQGPADWENLRGPTAESRLGH
jgi:hypothetical protein